MVRNKKIIYFGLMVLTLAGIFSWAVIYYFKERPLEVIFFDVGQGAASLIQASRSRQILIDGGPSSVILEKLAKEMPFWDRAIEVVILTHPEKDHLFGLIEVLKKYQVRNVLWTGVVRDTAEYQEWLAALIKEGANVEIARAGQKFSCDGRKINACFFEILSPFGSWQGRKMKDSNSSSIVAKLVNGKTSFLFTGDITSFEEKELVLKGADLKSGILKVAHHGSKTSTSEEFVKAVSPKTAVISAGFNNIYNHPHQPVLDVLEKYGINVLRTDLDGDIKIISNGKTYAVPDF